MNIFKSKIQQQYPFQLKDSIPCFKQISNKENIVFHTWLGSSWGVIFTIPDNEDQITLNELKQIVDVYKDFKQNDIKVLAISSKSMKDLAILMDKLKQLNVNYDFPIISDEDFKCLTILRLKEVINEKNFCQRHIMILDEQKKLRLSSCIPPPLQRDFHEVFSYVFALQLSDMKKVVTPCNWRKGHKFIVHPSIVNDLPQMQEYFQDQIQKNELDLKQSKLRFVRYVQLDE